MTRILRPHQQRHKLRTSSVQVGQHVGFSPLTDTQLKIGAMLIEIGVPVAITIALFVAPRFRPLCYAMLGSIAPLLFAYFSATISTWNAGDSAESLAVEAMWVRSLIGYLLVLTIGVLLGFYRRPERSVSRFMLSSVVSICVLWALVSFA
jgi:hypothetical protein